MNTHNTQAHSEIQKEQHTLVSSVLEKIQEEKICPTNKGYFIFRDVSLWTPGILVTIIGAFAWAGIIFNSNHSSWQYREFIGPQAVPFIIRELPTVWVIAFLFFALMMIKAFRQTKKGYKYNATTVLSVSVVVSFILGLIIVKSDVYYRNPLLRFPTERIQKSIWFSPEEGRIMGMINELPDGTFILTDVHNTSWVLDVHETPFIREFIATDTPMRIIGRVQPDTTFLVCMVLPTQLRESDKKEIKKIQSLTVSPLTQCHLILKEIRESHRERKNKLHP